MARRKKKQSDETLVDIVEVTGSAQNFFEKNQLYIFGGLAAAVLIVGGFFAYRLFFEQPRQKEAVQQMYKAQEQFERDSFKLALVNPGSGFPGFLDIMENYSGTKAANSARYYAGISYLHLGQFDAAIQYLKEFSADEEILPIMKNGALGDAYAEKGELDTALDYYEDAVDAGENQILTAYFLKKIGLLSEKQGDLDRAREAYETIQREYADSPDARDIEKYLVRVGSKG